MAQRDEGDHAETGPTPLLTEHDVYLLAEGTYRRAYERLGAHVVEHGGVRGVRFAVWAPNAAGVSVVGPHNGWDPAADPLRVRGTTGIWEGFLPGLGPGALYKFRIVARDGTPLPLKADPYAFQAESPPGTASVVADLDGYAWGDADWLASRPERQRHDRPLCIYEVHAGSWRRVPEEGNRPLTYHELGDALTPYAQQMGFTHVELMPITEYPADQSWGYQVTGYFAPTARYGTPHDFMAFVDRCHQQGIGVILDWVPAHFSKQAEGREDYGLGLFDGTHLYEHADPALGEHPVWGTWIFNYGRAEVRNFLLSSARFWLERYHVDGFRVDAVASMVWLDHARPKSHWGTNRFGGRENLDAVDFLRRFNAAVHEESPGAITIAEESTTYNWVTTLTHTADEADEAREQEATDAGDGDPADPAGAPGAVGTRAHTLGFDYKWNLGWMHDTLDYFALDPAVRSGGHGFLTFPIWYAFNERYVLPLSHDEVVHLKQALLTKMPGDDWQRFANLRALYGYMTAHPGKKLLFMGDEFGQWAEWSEARSLDWHLLDWAGEGGRQTPLHRGVQRCLADLNRLYAHLPALHQLDSLPRGFDWIDFGNAKESVIVFLRRGHAHGDIVVAACNFTPVVRHDYPVGVPVPGAWQEILNTDATEYGGSGVVNGGALWADAGTGFVGRGTVRCGQALRLTLPPLGVVFLTPGDGGRTDQAR
jgi:1,4-alpha-glucan branching enzyme